MIDYKIQDFCCFFCYDAVVMLGSELDSNFSYFSLLLLRVTPVFHIETQYNEPDFGGFVLMFFTSSKSDDISKNIRKIE